MRPVNYLAVILTSLTLTLYSNNAGADSSETMVRQSAYSNSLDSAYHNYLEREDKFLPDTTGISSAVIEYLMLTRRLPSDYAKKVEDENSTVKTNPEYIGRYDVVLMFKNDLERFGYTVDYFNALGPKRVTFIAFKMMMPSGALDTIKIDFDAFRKIGLDSSQIHRLIEIDEQGGDSPDSLKKYLDEIRIRNSESKSDSLKKSEERTK